MPGLRRSTLPLGLLARNQRGRCVWLASLGPWLYAVSGPFHARFHCRGSCPSYSHSLVRERRRATGPRREAANCRVCSACVGITVREIEARVVSEFYPNPPPRHARFTRPLPGYTYITLVSQREGALLCLLWVIVKLLFSKYAIHRQFLLKSERRFVPVPSFDLCDSCVDCDV